MAKRTYTMERRATLEAQTRERIVRATVALHAKHGVLGTSFATIAKRADVSPQTVYNHFPALAPLLDACTGHVLDRAPALGPESLREGRTPVDRLELLARAVFARHAYLEPWMRVGWYEAALVPALGEILARGNAALRRLIATAVAPDREATDPFIAAAFVLLDYPAWKEFTQNRSSPAAARIVGRCLADLLPALTPPRKGKS